MQSFPLPPWSFFAPIPPRSKSLLLVPFTVALVPITRFVSAMLLHWVGFPSFTELA